jgi:murein L,D-transpeptidase YcbB/YkuD
VFGYVPQSQNGLEKKVDLPRSVPVYMTYLTVAATANGVTFRPDIYGFDALAMPQMFGGTASIASAEELGHSLGSN